MLVGGYVVPIPVAAGSRSVAGAGGEDGDGAVCYRDPVSGRVSAAVAASVADADGSAAENRRAVACRAAEVAAWTAASSGATVGAVLAAQHALDQDPGDGAGGDLALVVVTLIADGDGGGFSMSWVGDCRGYRLRGRGLEQVTTDQTVAELRRRGRRRETPQMLEVLETTLRTARVDTIGHVRESALPWRLALTTRGVHRTVRAPRITRILRTAHTCQDAARRLTAAAGDLDVSATAVVLEPGSSVPLTQSRGPLEIPW